MRLVAACCLVIGCRMNFGVIDVPDGDGGANSLDATAPSSCVATMIPGFDAGTSVTDLLAAEMPSGYAIGVVRSPTSDLTGVLIDPSLQPSFPAPARMSPVGSGQGSYVSGSFYWDGANLTGALRENNSNVWLKTYPTSMDDFLSAELRTSSGIGEPSIGRTGGTTRSVWFTGMTVNYAVLDGSGIPIANSDTVLGDAPSTILSGSVSSAGDEMFVFSALSTLACHVQVIDEQDNAVSNQIPSPCTDPHAVGNTVVYKSGSDIVLRSVTSSGLVISSPTTITTSGSNPRLFAGGSLVAFVNAAGIAIATDAGVLLPMSGLPMIPPDAFETAGPYVFAVFGGDLYAIRCP